MPREGYKTITIKEEVYNDLHKQWENERLNLAKRGITNFSGYILYRLNLECKV